MVQQYLSSVSQTISLTVLGYAFGQIMSFEATTPHGPGEMVGAAVVVRNDGEAGEVYVDVWDNDTGELLWRSPRRQMAVSEVYTFQDADIGPMPNRNWGLVAQAHHDGEVDTMASFIVELVLVVPTTLNLELNKSAVSPDEDYDWSGYLRRDTGEGIVGQWVSCRRNGVEVARVSTDDNGFYWARTPAPPEPGVYQNQSVFEEATIAGITVLGSKSKTIGLGVGVPTVGVSSLAVMLGSTLIGLGLVYISSRK